jgi:DNA-binding GntR family transcriptional regulator
MDDDAPPRQLPRGIGYIWQRLADDLRQRIEAGEWEYGDRLPSRDDLAADYGVGERTVRHALQALPGHVEVLPAKGAYVTWRGYEQGT